jgi:hypothetical protein
MSASVPAAIGPGYAGVPARPRWRRPLASTLAIAAASVVAVGVSVATKPLLGLVVVAAVAIALVLVDRPLTSVYLMVMIAPSCAGLQRGLLVPGLRVSELTVAGLGGLVLLFASRMRSPAWTGVEKLLLVYAVVGASLGGLDLALRHAPLDTTELGTLLGPFQFVIIVRAIVLTLDTERRRVRAVNLFLGAAVVVALISLAQFANLGPTRTVLTSLTGSTLFSESLGEGAGRVTGPFNIWHELAGFLMPAVLLSMAMLTQARTKVQRNWYLGALALTGGALLATTAIGVLIVTLLGIAYLAWQRKVLHVVLALALPAILIVAVVFGGTFSGRSQQQLAPTSSTYKVPLAPQTISYRYAIFEEQSVPALSGHWATGYGPDLPPQLALGNFPYAETTYVTLLLRGGVVLLVIFLGLLIATARMARAVQRRARTEFEAGLASVVLIMTVGYLVLQLIESYLLDSGPPHAYWAIVGILLAGSGSLASRKPPPAGDRSR